MSHMSCAKAQKMISEILLSRKAKRLTSKIEKVEALVLRPAKFVTRSILAREEAGNWKGALSLLNKPSDQMTTSSSSSESNPM